MLSDAVLVVIVRGSPGDLHIAMLGAVVSAPESFKIELAGHIRAYIGLLFHQFAVIPPMHLPLIRHESTRI